MQKKSRLWHMPLYMSFFFRTFAAELLMKVRMYCFLCRSVKINIKFCVGREENTVIMEI